MSSIDWNELGLDIGLLAAATVVCIFSIVAQFGNLEPKQKNWRFIVGNTFAWINVLYVIAVVATILRMVLKLTLPGVIPNEVYTIVYNWAASLICAINAIMPIKFIRMTFNPFVIKLTADQDLPIMIGVAGVWVLLLLSTIIAAVVVGESVLAPALVAWRYYFMSVAFVELFALTWFIIYCMTGLNKSISSMKVQGNNLLLFCVTTFILRVAIVVSNLCKIYAIAGVTPFSMRIIHMCFTCICVTAFNIPKFMGWGTTKGKSGSTVSASASAAKSGANNSTLDKSGKSSSVVHVQSPAMTSPSSADNARQRSSSQRREKSTSMGA